MGKYFKFNVKIVLEIPHPLSDDRSSIEIYFGFDFPIVLLVVSITKKFN